MEVLRPVSVVRRERKKTIAGLLALATLPLLAAAIWATARPGTPVQSALGVPVPTGSRLIHEEHAHGFDAAWLTSGLSAVDVTEYYARRAIAHRPATRRYTLDNGFEVVVGLPKDIPATGLLPIRAVTDGVPLGTRSWIGVIRGRHPNSTSSFSVGPHLGES